MTDLTAGQIKFIDQYTRKLMVVWCHEALAAASPAIVLLGPTSVSLDEHQPGSAIDDAIYRQYAISKGWISAKEGKVKAAGWATAAAFLKR